jgi:hypothetical protein
MEGKKFFELTSIKITEIRNPIKITQAYNYINETPLKRLNFASEFFIFTIEEYPE